jgi:hypothetical protein
VRSFYTGADTGNRERFVIGNHYRFRIPLKAHAREVALQPFDPSAIWLGELICDPDQVRLEGLVDSRDQSLSLLDTFDLGVGKFLLLLAVTEKCNNPIPLLLSSLQRLTDFVQDHLLNRGVFGKVDGVDQRLQRIFELVQRTAIWSRGY